MEQQVTEIGGWAIIEMLGHRKYAGQVSPVSGFGGLLSIAIPGVEKPIIIGAGSIFQITPVSEEYARTMAEGLLVATSWQQPHLRTLLPNGEEPSPVMLYTVELGDDEWDNGSREQVGEYD